LYEWQYGSKHVQTWVHVVAYIRATNYESWLPVDKVMQQQ